MIVEVPDLLPGACFVTGRNDGPFIDTGYDVEDRPNVGRVYIAASFIADCADMLGGLGPEAAQILRDGCVQRDARIAELEAAVAGLTTANEALLAAGYNPAPIEPIGAPVDLADLSDDELLERAVVADLPIDRDATRDDIIAALSEAVPA